MKHYKIIYELTGYDTQHSRFYDSESEAGARENFYNDSDNFLPRDKVKIIRVTRIEDGVEHIVECEPSGEKEK